MTSPTTREACAAVEEELALLVDGNEEALERHGDHLADCDACRDLVHDARQAARVVVGAGADYVPPEDLEERVLAAIDAQDEPAAAPEASASDAAERPKETPRADAEPAASARSGGARPASRRAPWIMAAAAVFLVAAGGIGLWMSNSSKNDGPDSPSVGPGAGGPVAGNAASIEQIVRAAADGQTGLTVRPAGGGQFQPATPETQLAPGTTLRTDARTRVRLTLAEGTRLVLNHGTELTLDGQTPRLLRLSAGEVLAEVTHLENSPNATFATPTGRVEVIGTKLVVSATDELTSVRVTRGQVRIHGLNGGEADVKAGEEGLLSREGGVSVAPAVNLAGSVRWGELSQEADGAEVTRSGVGELRAKRPGEREEVERPLTLANHKVRVRIMGNVARTEVEEVFRNDSDQTLEGIYRFPMPPDARIARLALEVNGQLEEGAFVERGVASKIWQGVIRRATPQQQREQQQEFIWVPGPWRDPALLEWQRGGRFELRIFPIKARSDRRVILAYDQTIQPQGKRRRYVYPLAHSADASTRIGRFEADIRVAGANADEPVASHGYGMQTKREGNATRLTFTQDSFLPNGDLVIDYALPDSSAEIRYWTYQGNVAAAPTVEAGARGRKRGPAPEVVEAQRQIAADTRPFVAFAIRPELPVRTEAERQDYVLVVDSSQSMVGERYSRAAQLVAALVSEMDRRDRFALMACDAECQSLPGGFRSPSSQEAAEVASWLGGIRPAGSSDLIASLRGAAGVAAGSAAQGRSARVIYVGDGIASVGHRRAGAVAAAVRNVSTNGSIRFTTVGIGGDSDTLVLGAIARAGGGHFVPYTPGQRAGSAALAVLETTYGVTLQRPTVELPEGVTEVAPSELPTIRNGEELIVAGRFSGEVRGEVVLRGTVGGEAYEDRYPVHLTVSTAAGNAFVPRLWAAQTIEDRQLSSRGEDRSRVVALSRAFGVMSRHTSLLVLESAAMFEAFGIDRARPTVDWTGEEEMDESQGEGTATHAGASVFASRSKSASRALGGLARGDLDDVLSGAMGGGGVGRGAMPMEEARAPAAAPSAAMDEMAGPGLAQNAPSTRGRGSRRARREAPARRPTPRPPGPGRWMKRVWERVGSIQTGWSVFPAEQQRVDEAEQALREAPDSRDRHRDLVRALTRAGNLERALVVAEQWVTRDQLDPEALVALADILGRMGRRDESLRLLTGVVDLRPDDSDLHERLVEAFERSGMPARACSHRVAIAEASGDETDEIAAAVRCERALGEAQLASHLLDSLSDAAARQRVERALSVPPRTRPIRGDMMVEATWPTPQDLDISIINFRGARYSWMGGRSNVVGESARTPGRERLGLRWTPRGSYVVEISRTDPNDRTPVSGQLQIRLLGERRTIPFTLTGERATVARLRVTRQSRLVPAS